MMMGVYIILPKSDMKTRKVSNVTGRKEKRSTVVGSVASDPGEDEKEEGDGEGMESEGRNSY